MFKAQNFLVKGKEGSLHNMPLANQTSSSAFGNHIKPMPARSNVVVAKPINNPIVHQLKPKLNLKKGDHQQTEFKPMNNQKIMLAVGLLGLYYYMR